MSERKKVVPLRRVGTHGPDVSVLSLGSWHTYDRMNFEDAVAMVSHAVELGVNLFDVGVYGIPGQPPVFTDVLFSAIVRAAGIDRDDYLLSSKLWLEPYPEQSLREQLERALFRVGSGRADLVVLGDIRRDDLDLRRLAADLAELEADGIIGCWGVNNWSATAVRTIRDHALQAGSPGPQIAQLKYSPCRRSIPDGAPFAEVFAEGITMQASDVMEGGILAGRTAPTREIGRDPGGVRGQIMEAADGIAAVAADLGATAAQLCVAFTLTHPSVSTVLFGASRMEQLVDNVGALALLERVGAPRLRELLDPFWADRGVVDPEGP
ncbi:aldo/keto reductase [Streptosporangium roseum]|uniref:Oxidoreductase (Related to aryl-alcohol dehydrogenase)-like protein n=1 Tax=Streptosporangium roseum (strain ATCC 12428 / DSM 43021 / JCM 3005 / KCTC 9067 / NCIMB 10171 / NRRL 2505 / NI 9100) TaxID=479432 RepID=D2BFM6_STRRD|nr:aldo/keto reductase [Streptosporangium roseum]ACZ90187.1 oxidoreductase (related to aryl-alcohol dehydrogenase)-like protein [Streptosporangium roseum DSM 43021]